MRPDAGPRSVPSLLFDGASATDPSGSNFLNTPAARPDWTGLAVEKSRGQLTIKRSKCIGSIPLIVSRPDEAKRCGPYHPTGFSAPPDLETFLIDRVQSSRYATPRPRLPCALMMARPRGARSESPTYMLFGAFSRSRDLISRRGRLAKNELPK